MTITSASLLKLKSMIGGLKTNLSSRCSVPEKLIVFESDDWGAIRMPSRSTLNTFSKNGIDLNSSVYKVDALASKEDLEDLFDLLLQFKGADDRPPVFTANAIMANPDFSKIEASDFNEYHFEVFSETFLRYPNHRNNLEIWKDGLQSGVFRPQLHGREHLNVHRWLDKLKSGDPKTLFSFRLGSTYSGVGDYSFMEAFDWSQKAEVDFHKQVLHDAVDIFNKHFDYRSKTFIFPCYTWDPILEPFLKGLGVELLQGSTYQNVPTGSFDNYLKVKHAFGERSTEGILYNTRNVVFEPVMNINTDYVSKAMGRISAAFMLNKPAVISTHRINYVGFIDEGNKAYGLRQLQTLLKQILKKWPSVKFISSDQLIDYV